jgi:hypothetical protein
MRAISVLLCAFLAASGGVAAQPAPPPGDGARPGNIIGTGMSLPRSDTASNLDAQTTRSELAPNLPAPPATDDIQTLLLDARQSLLAGRSGEAQEALERAETRALDRSIPAGTEHVVARGPLVVAMQRARAALAAGDIAGATRIINAALPRAARADLPMGIVQ